MTREELIHHIRYALDIGADITLTNEEGEEIIKALDEDAVSRQAVIDVIEKWLECSDYNRAERHIMRAIESILYDLPSVAPKEKMAKWVPTDEEPYEAYGGRFTKCNACGWLLYDVDTTDFKYCPNCGARMVSE